MLPRYVIVTAASQVALALGTAGALYETTVLLGNVHLAPLAAALGLEALWVCFAVSVVAAVASMTRSVLSIVGISVTLLLALAVLGNLSVIYSWLPSRLSSSAALLVGSPANGIWFAVLVAALATSAALVLDVNRFGARES